MGVNTLSYSKDGLALTQLFEGDVLHAYQDQKGVWTIGYGHTAGVQPGQTITQAQAEAFLMGDVGSAVNCVNEVVEVLLTQQQFDALVDFTFNLGPGAFKGSTLLKDINTGNFPAAISQFDLWDHCGGVVNAGLLRRRQAETAEFAGTRSSSSSTNNS